MMDFSHLPQTGGSRLDIFVPEQTTNDYQVWRKPRNCSFVYILAIGAGTGGGGGGAAASTSTAGGAGGPSGAISKLFIPAVFLPDTLMMNIGLGSAGAAQGGQGVAAGNTTIRPYAGSTSILRSAATQFVTGGGANITAATSQSLGGSEIAAAGIFLSSNGIAGLAGALGTAVATYASDGLITRGNAGAGVAATFTAISGGSIQRIAFDPNGSTITVNGGTGGTNGTAGQDGIGILPSVHNPYTFYSLGGAGGGNGTTTGGRGGSGFYGSGGGGGGSRLGGTTGGGVGGKGGDGIVIIWSF